MPPTTVRDNREVDHLPINHPLRSFWRVLAFFTGAYILVFGIVGYISASDAGLDWFAQDNLPSALWLKANPAFSLMSIIMGAIVVLATLIGRNVDRYVNFVLGTVQLLVGIVMLGLQRTDLNYLGFGVATCIASFILGMILITAALYGRVGSVAEADAEEIRRHNMTSNDDDGVLA